MFTPASPDSNSFNKFDSNSSGRGNIPTRYPVGITSLGDENQQIRIQLAVHKYNSSSNTFKNNKQNSIYQPQHCLLRNSLKARNYEENGEAKSKKEKKNGNSYDGVGAFPTVHLKKNSILYRPIRRFKDVKVPHPDLPVNRFLSNLPEFSPHMKNNTRSVLEVLQDLSRKKINTTEEEQIGSQTHTKGLGGDFTLGTEAVYKPLFVPKTKVINISTRDNTTQTLIRKRNQKTECIKAIDTILIKNKLFKNGIQKELSHSSESPNSENKSSRLNVTSSGDSDPKAELRRKLASQNNEIFASLSSSIDSHRPSKRKIDKVLPAKDNEHLNDVSAAKKTKRFEHRGQGSEEKFISPSNDQLVKMNRKSKICESSPASPNKDRLTTIYLDLQNISPKTQIFRNSPESNESKELEKPSEKNSILPSYSDSSTIITNGSSSKNFNFQSAEVNGFGKSSSVIYTSTTFSKDPLSSESQKPTSDDGKNSETVNFLRNKINNSSSGSNILKSDIQGTVKFDAEFKNNSSNSQPAPFLSIWNEKNSGQESISAPENANSNLKSATFSTLDVSKDQKKNENKSDNNFLKENKTIVPGFFNLGSPENLKSLKDKSFSQNGNATCVTAEDTLKANSSAILTNSGSTNLNSVLTNESKSSDLPSGPQESGFRFGQSIYSANDKTQKGVSDSTKTFECLSSPENICQENWKKKEENSLIFGASSANIKIPSSFGVSSSLPGLSVPVSGIFSFGNKSEKIEQSKADGKAIVDIGQCANNSSNETILGQLDTGLQDTKKNSDPAFSDTSTGNQIASDKKSSPPFHEENHNLTDGSGAQSDSLKAFGQEPTMPIASDSSSSNSINSVKNQNPPPSLFSFGSKAESKNCISSKPSESSLFVQKSSPNLFSFGRQVPTQESHQIGSKSTESLSTNSSSQKTAQESEKSAINQPLFGQNISQVSATGPQSTNQGMSFSQSSSSVPTSTNVFQNKSEAAPFGSVPTISSLSQGNPPFASKVNVFESSISNQSGTKFGSSQTISSFGVPSTSQSDVSFNVCGTSSPHSFGASTAPQSTTGFGSLVFTQANNGFGNPSTAQSSISFGNTATTQSSSVFKFSAGSSQPNTNFGTTTTQPVSMFVPDSASQNSVAQGFGQNDNKPINALTRTSSIFGQSSSNFAVPDGCQNNIFGQKSETSPSSTFQPKSQLPSFGQNQPFAAPNKFSFGSSPSIGTEFANSHPNSTATSVFNFGVNNPAQGSTFSFGNSSSSSSSTSANSQTPFAFKGNASEAFKFEASSAKEGTGFGGNGNALNFSFVNQQSGNVSSETKPASTGFSFGSTETTSTTPGFNFGSTPSPSVFSFGGSTSTANPGFNFGTPQTGGILGQPSSASPAPFSAPGTFSIGWGSSQSRPRAASRLRRRP